MGHVAEELRRGPRRPDRRGAGRRRQDDLRVRSRRSPRRSISSSSTAPPPAGGRSGRRSTRGPRAWWSSFRLELPHRHSMRRRRRGAGGGQHGDPQAGLRRRAGGVGTLPVLLARRRIARRRCNSCPAPAIRRGGKLVNHPGVNAVILTGGTETALHMLRDKPSLHLFAETGGKNATIVTAMADRDQAIKHVVHSAFSHAGQKCSATSLLLLEAEVYDDPKFKHALCDAVKSLRRRLGVGAGNQDGPAHPPAVRRPGKRPESARTRGVLGRRAAAVGEQSQPLVAGREVRRAARQLHAPDRVLRPGARRDALRQARARRSSSSTRRATA